MTRAKMADAQTSAGLYADIIQQWIKGLFNVSIYSGIGCLFEAEQALRYKFRGLFWSFKFFVYQRKEHK